MATRFSLLGPEPDLAAFRFSAPSIWFWKSQIFYDLLWPEALEATSKQILSIANVIEILLFLNSLLEDLFRDKAKLQALCPRESLEWVEDLKNTHMKNLAKVQFSKYKKSLCIESTNPQII